MSRFRPCSSLAPEPAFAIRSSGVPGPLDPPAPNQWPRRAEVAPPRPPPLPECPPLPSLQPHYPALQEVVPRGVDLVAVLYRYRCCSQHVVSSSCHRSSSFKGAPLERSAPFGAKGILAPRAPGFYVVAGVTTRIGNVAISLRSPVVSRKNNASEYSPPRGAIGKPVTVTTFRWEGAVT